MPYERFYNHIQPSDSTFRFNLQIQPSDQSIRKAFGTRMIRAMKPGAGGAWLAVAPTVCMGIRGGSLDPNSLQKKLKKSLQVQMILCEFVNI